MPRLDAFFCTKAGFTLSDLDDAFFATRFFAAVFFVLTFRPALFFALPLPADAFFGAEAPVSGAGTASITGAGSAFTSDWSLLAWAEEGSDAAGFTSVAGVT